MRSSIARFLSFCYFYCIMSPNDDLEIKQITFTKSDNLKDYEQVLKHLKDGDLLLILSQIAPMWSRPHDLEEVFTLVKYHSSEILGSILLLYGPTFHGGENSPGINCSVDMNIFRGHTLVTGPNDLIKDLFEGKYARAALREITGRVKWVTEQTSSMNTWLARDYICAKLDKTGRPCPVCE